MLTAKYVPVLTDKLSIFKEIKIYYIHEKISLPVHGNML